MRVRECRDGMDHLVKRRSNKGQKHEEFGVNIGETAIGTAIDTSGVNDNELFELLNDAPGGHLEALLLNLPLHQVVGKQSNHVQKDHRSDAFILVQKEERDLQVTFTNMKAGFDAVFLAVEAKHLVMGKREIVGDQKIATICAFGCSERLLIQNPVKSDLSI